VTFRHRGWYIVDGLHKTGPCPICYAMVPKVYWTAHQRRCAELEDLLHPLDDGDPGGYVIGDGPLPVSVRGGSDEDNEQQAKRR